MKLDLQAKFLQHLSQKKQDEGFTLIELLVVIIIIGILSAIALPSFLNQANKAKESEAKQYVGSMNRSEQAFYLEKSAFTTSIVDLGLGIKTSTQNYKYIIAGGGTKDSSGYYPESAPNGLSQKPTLRSYIGSVVTGSTAAGTAGESTTLAVLCQTKTPGSLSTTLGPFVTGAGTAAEPDCPAAKNLDFIR
jgi:type IV pilus assembly protein PilA